MPDMDFVIIDLALLLLVTLCALATIEVRSLFGATMLAGIYSLLMAVVWVNMDAVDVAFTEAAVGAGISTILLIGTLVLVGPHEVVRRRIHFPALAVVLLVGAALIYGTLDMPHFGDPNSPTNRHALTRGMIQQDVKKSPTGKSGQLPAQEHATAHGDYFHGYVPNQVTAVIVSYRAFDTMFECCVILTAGFSMILLLRGRRGNPLKGGLL